MKWFELVGTILLITVVITFLIFSIVGGSFYLQGVWDENSIDHNAELKIECANSCELASAEYAHMVRFTQGRSMCVCHKTKVNNYVD